jgi:hypothetical protein
LRALIDLDGIEVKGDAGEGELFAWFCPSLTCCCAHRILIFIR